MSIQDDIKRSVDTHSVEDIYSVMQEHGVDCSTRRNGKLLDIPGYGEIFWDDQPGVEEPGYVVRHDYDEPVEPGELVDELVDLVEDVQKVQ